MVMKQRGQKTYRSMQGKQVDMDMLRQRNELAVAVGNARVNARGDELGPGGKIIRKKEELDRDYYTDNPASMPDEQATVEQEATEVVAEAVAEVAQAPRTTRSRAQQKVEKDLTDDWVEDSDGNFTQKGE
tara:strand:- start:329 stop:718 length:390 start_codon:yes stop_codon:yes gene_type:complete